MNLKFKSEGYVFNGETHYWHLRRIYDGKVPIGSVAFVRDRRKLYLMFIEIKREYRGRGYAEAVLNKLLSYKNVDCVVGETLRQSRGFWHKMIKKYNGTRRNVTYYDNTTSSFVIPKNEITNDEMYEMFDKWDKV